MKRALRPALVLVTLGVLGCASTPPPMEPSKNPPAPPMGSSDAPKADGAAAKELKEGDPAPVLDVLASNGMKIDLVSLKGKQVVVYFYPKDDTPGCTKEACAFRDAWAKLEAAGVLVVGVSEDDDASHKAFAEKHKLPIPLVADVDGSIAARFGVPLHDGYAARMSFLIGKDGKIKKVYPKVDPAVHCDQILADAAN